MDIVIYIDIYFWINFSMDFIILYTVSKLKRIGIRYFRIILGSLLGAFASCVTIIMAESNPLLRMVIGYIIAPLLIILLTFGFGNFARFISSILYLYAVTIMLGGLLNCIFYNFTLGKYLRRIYGGTRGYSISLFMLILVVGILLVCLPYMVRKFHLYRKRTNNIYSVSLSMDDKMVEAKGLFDTGNYLREPISNKPVIIVEQALLKQIMNKGLVEYATRVKVIPYRSIGKEHGTMYALVIDKLSVVVNEEVHEHKDVIACIYKGTLSSKKDYQLILHEELL